MQPVRLIDLIVALLLIVVSAATGFGVGIGLNTILAAMGVAAPNAWSFAFGFGFLAGATSFLYYGFMLWHLRWLPQPSVATTETREAVEFRLAMVYGIVMGAIGWEAGGAGWCGTFGGTFAIIGWCVGSDLRRRQRRLVERDRRDAIEPDEHAVDD